MLPLRACHSDRTVVAAGRAAEVATATSSGVLPSPSQYPDGVIPEGAPLGRSHGRGGPSSVMSLLTPSPLLQVPANA